MEEFYGWDFNLTVVKALNFVNGNFNSTMPLILLVVRSYAQVFIEDIDYGEVEVQECWTMSECLVRPGGS